MSADASPEGDPGPGRGNLRAALPGGSDLPELDPVIHAQPRLRIVVALSTLWPGDRITFPRLQELVGMTSGNLATHLRRLEDADYVDSTKAFRQRVPVTWLSLTPLGRRALEEYTETLRSLLTTAERIPPGQR